jgi:deazaflavin-dependent oxidoreductase (nitroreductase family)
MLLYRLRLGWLTDHWLMIITHIGRRSGKIRRTIVYVQYYNPQTREAMVIAAWGVTDWYRNICARPALAIEIGKEQYVPTQRILEAEEIAELERAFRRQHPVVARAQCWLMNWPWQCSDAEFLAYARSLRGVAFRPQS